MRTSRMNPDTVAAPIGSYSQSVRVETADATWIYVSGQIAVDLDDELVAPERPARPDPTGLREPDGGPRGARRGVRRRREDRDVLHDARRARRDAARSAARYLPAVPPASTAVQVVALVVPDARDRGRRGGGDPVVSTIAVLGLGAMGHAIAARLLAAEHDLGVWNRTPGKDDELVAAGARRADSPADAVRDAEVVITMLTDPPALEEVLFGSEGVAVGDPSDRHAHRDVDGGSDRDRLRRRAARTGRGAGRTGARQRPLGPGRQARDPRRWEPGGVRPPHRAPVDHRDADLPRTVGFGRVAEAGQQRGVDRDPGGPRRAPRAHRPRRPRDRRRPPGPGGRSARLADRTVAGPAASQGRGPGLLLPPRARAQGPRRKTFDEAERKSTELTVAEAAAARCDEAIEAGLGNEDFGAISSRSCGGSHRAEAVRLPSSA